MARQRFVRPMHRLLPFALVLALAGCIAAPQPEPQPAALPQVPQEAREALADLGFTDEEGTLLSLPMVGRQAEFTYDVPEGARWVAATLKWATRGTVLALAAKDPTGAEAGESRTLAGSGPRSPTRLDWWAAAPAAGAWTFTVTGDAALQEPVTIQFHTSERPGAMHVAQRTLVAATGFVEVNLEMTAGQAFTYEWLTDAPVHFDIHTHRDGETIYLVDETAEAGLATFTAEEDGGYSLLWAQEGAGGLAPPTGGEAVPLAYRVDGDYDLHSGVG